MKNKLSELLNEDTIISVSNLKNWREAIDVASKPLLKNESIENRYVEAMKNSVDKYGAYMVLTDYFALMHARPQDGVNKASMSLLVTRKSVDLVGKEVKLFLVLAAKDDKSHIEYLSEITELLSDKKIFDIFIDGDKEKIIKIIKEERK